MPKYYITSGNLKFIATAPSTLEACYKALQAAKRNEILLEKYFYVSEKGFRNSEDFKNQNSITTNDVYDEQIDVQDIQED